MQDLLTNVGPRDNTPAQDGVITISAFGTDERTVPAGRTVLETLRQAGMMPATYEDVHLNGKRVADLDNTTLRTGDRLYLSPHPQGG